MFRSGALSSSLFQYFCGIESRFHQPRTVSMPTPVSTARKAIRRVVVLPGQEEMMSLKDFTDG